MAFWSPVDDWIEHGVSYGQDLGNVGEIVKDSIDILPHGWNPLHDVQKKPEMIEFTQSNFQKKDSNLFSNFQ